jgi:glycosyltransferase involved in cell wall biosynthesis
MVKKQSRIIFIEQSNQSDGRFLTPIVNSLKSRYNVKYLRTLDAREVQKAVEWAEIVWLEWANQLAIHVTNKVSQIKSKKVVCRLHGYEIFSNMPAQINWDVVDRLVFVANHKKEMFSKKFKNASVKKVVIRNGICLKHFTISPRKENTKKLVLLGYLNFRKGLPVLLHFYQQLLKHDPSYHLFIRGEFQDPRLEMAAKTMIREMELGDKIEFVGWVNDLNSWFADKSHILSFSLEESFHYALGDGMAAGLKPVIHAWNESRDIWPNEYIFRNLDEFLELMQDSSFTPRLYRKTLVDYNIDSVTQLSKIENLLENIVLE